MLESIKMFECPVCNKYFKEEKTAMECLEGHTDVIFLIETLKVDHDCWGRFESYWERTDITFKSYEKAQLYVSQHGNMRIKIIHLA